MNHLQYNAGPGSKENWVVREAVFDPRYLGKCESIFCLGNGYLNVRSALEERYVGETRDLLVTGTFNRADETEVTELPNLPDITNVDILLDGKRFRMDAGTLQEYRRELDLQTGELSRHVVWASPEGNRVKLDFFRFVSKENEHLIGGKLEITPLSQEVKIGIHSGIDGRVTNSGAQHFLEGSKRVYEGEYLEMVSRTNQSGVTAAVHTTHRVFLNGKAQTVPALPVITRRTIENQMEIVVPAGETLVVEKLSCVHTSRDLAYEKLSSEEAAKRTAADGLSVLRTARQEGYDRLFEKSREAWRLYWEPRDVKITCENGFDQLALRFALYHLAIMAKTDDSRVGIGAKGMSGEGYKGHSFWDTEIFILPYFMFTDPGAAKTLLEYRYHTLGGAYAKAKEYGFLGAMYPWESAWADDGEVTPKLGGADVVTGKPIPILTGELEQHVSADIAYTVWQYWLMTGDREFMERCGVEIITQTGRFWASRLEWNPEKKQFEINDVIGPDEYKEHVNNNAYTNYMAHYNMELALKLIRELREQEPALYTGLCARLPLEETEREISEKLDLIYLPQPDDRGLIPQFDGYFGLREIDLTPYKDRETVGTIYNDYNAEQINGIMVLKQADLLVLFYLLDDLFPAELKEKNYMFYEAHTLHDSSLSKSTHCVLACDLGLSEQAYWFYQGACLTDLGQKMLSSDMGIHSAAMGGIWQNVVLGFGGVRLVGGKLQISPCLPEGWSRLEFPLVFRGTPLRVAAERNRVVVENRGTVSVTLRLCGKELELAAGSRYEEGL